MRRYVRCTSVGAPADVDAEPVLSDGCMDIIFDGARLFIAGPDTPPVAGQGNGRPVVGLRALPDLSLAEIAVRCGYSDQAHLSRDATSLGGRTPSQLRAARVSDVRNVQDKE